MLEADLIVCIMINKGIFSMVYMYNSYHTYY